MPNENETARTAPADTEARLNELLQAKDGKLAELRAQLANAEAAQQNAEQKFHDEKARANRAVEKAHQAQQDARTATSRAKNLKTKLENANIAETILEEEKNARGRLREFVQQSISEILAGVDDAAVDARHRQLDGGLSESGFITPGRVGSIAGKTRDWAVEFDLAVVAGKQQTDGKTTGTDKQASAKISFMDVIPLGLSAEARLAVRNEQRSEEHRELTRHNRIRFSVPITFASLDDPTE